FETTGSSGLKLRAANAGAAVVASLPSNSNWHYVVGTITGTTGTIFVDGASSATASVATGIQNTTNTLRISSHSGGAYFFNGKIDEVRVSKTVRANDWITTCYNNQFSPSTFESLGAEELAGTIVTVTGVGGTASVN